MNPAAPAILIVEDNAELSGLLSAGLQEERINVLAAATVGAAERIIQEKTLDLILLDLGLADGDGTEILDFLQKSGRLIPAIIISARADVDERIRTLGLGADDYLVKPFSFAEMLARIRAVLRRAQSSDKILSVGAVRIDLAKRCAYCHEESVELSPREFDLLAYLARHANSPVSRDTLARDVFHVRSRATPMDNVLEVNISRLRNKLAGAGDVIQTVRGIGYRLAAP